MFSKENTNQLEQIIVKNYPNKLQWKRDDELITFKPMAIKLIKYLSIS